MSTPEVLPTPESIAKYVKQNMRKASPMMAMMHHEGAQEIVREDDYKGHHIVVRTTYHITVDGQEVTGHIMLTNAGQVQYHGLPNHSFDSTVGLVRALIDNFPEDFDKKKKPSKPHGSMNMGGMAKKPGIKTSGMKMPGMKMPGMKMAMAAKSKTTASKKKPAANKKKASKGKSK